MCLGHVSMAMSKQRYFSGVMIPVYQCFDQSQIELKEVPWAVIPGLSPSLVPFFNVGLT